MLNNISVFLRNEEYRISLLPNKIHIMNYKKIVDINDNEVIIKVADKVLRISGKNLRLVKLDKSELLLTGLVEGLKLNE